ncbi:MAG: hypothetical protein D6732_27355, partial [Methanobacteriota archaeon]
MVSDKIYLGLTEIENRAIVASRIVRFNSDGSIDNSFAENGVLSITNSDYPSAFLTDFLVDKNGNIFVLGSHLSSAYQYILMKYDANSNVDAAFGTVSLPEETTGAYIADMHFADDEFLYIGWENGASNIRITRVPLSSPSNYNSVVIEGYHFGSLKVVRNGTFYVTAAKTNTLESYVFRYNDSLNLDESFGSGGMATISNLNGYEPYRLDYISTNSAGSIFLSGSGRMPGNNYRAITAKLVGTIPPLLPGATFTLNSPKVKLVGEPTDSTRIELMVSVKSSSVPINSFELTISGFSDSLNFNEVISYISYNGWTIQSAYTGDTLKIIGATTDSEIPPDTNAVKLCGIILYSENRISPGNYTFKFEEGAFNHGEGIPQSEDGTLTILPSSIGDIDLNGTIQAYDASLILRYLVNDITLSSEQLIRADVTGDESVSAFDAVKILQYVVGLITSLPDSTSSSAGGELYFSQPIVNSDIVEVQVMISNPQSLFSVSLDFDYNEEYFELLSVNYSENLSSALIADNSALAVEHLSVAASSNEEIISGGELMTLKFRKKKSVQSDSDGRLILNR